MKKAIRVELYGFPRIVKSRYSIELSDLSIQLQTAVAKLGFLDVTKDQVQIGFFDDLLFPNPQVMDSELTIKVIGPLGDDSCLNHKPPEKPRLRDQIINAVVKPVKRFIKTEFPECEKANVFLINCHGTEQSLWG